LWARFSCGKYLANPEQGSREWWLWSLGKETIDWWWEKVMKKFYVDGEKFPSTYGTGSEITWICMVSRTPFQFFLTVVLASQPRIHHRWIGHTLL